MLSLGSSVLYSEPSGDQAQCHCHQTFYGEKQSCCGRHQIKEEEIGKGIFLFKKIKIFVRQEIINLVFHTTNVLTCFNRGAMK